MSFKLTNTRLFTFGCSFTQYLWPTWADILGKNFTFYENWGLAGAGNLYIFNSIIEAHKRHNFNSYDTIIVMWSGHTRVDYYNNNAWQPQGSDFSFVNNDQIGNEVINYAYVECIKQLFDSLKLNYKMLCLYAYPRDTKAYHLYKDSIDSLTVFPYKAKDKVINLNLNNIKNTYFYDLIKNAYNRNAGSEWPNFDVYWDNPSVVTNKKIANEIKICLSSFKQGYAHLQDSVTLHDDHPTPLEHLDAIVKLFPDYNLTKETQQWIHEFDHMVTKNTIFPYTTNYPKTRL